MPRKRTGYDAACYYDGKLLGRCTKADSDAYTLLMNACGGEAARVLREYAYFSPELKPTPTPTEQPEEPKGKGGNPGVVLALVLFPKSYSICRTHLFVLFFDF